WVAGGGVRVAFGPLAGLIATACPAPAPRGADAAPGLAGRCAPQAGCEFTKLPGLDALAALLDALDETIRNVPAGGIRDQGTADAITAKIADARQALGAGGARAPALRNAPGGPVGTGRRAPRPA